MHLFIIIEFSYVSFLYWYDCPVSLEVHILNKKFNF